MPGEVSEGIPPSRIGQRAQAVLAGRVGRQDAQVGIQENQAIWHRPDNLLHLVSLLCLHLLPLLLLLLADAPPPAEISLILTGPGRMDLLQEAGQLAEIDEFGQDGKNGRHEGELARTVRSYERSSSVAVLPVTVLPVAILPIAVPSLHQLLRKKCQ